MDSPPHRKTLLDRAFARIGVGLARGTFQGVAGASVWTADFASAPLTLAEPNLPDPSGGEVRSRVLSP